jgi:hypothetical protein
MGMEGSERSAYIATDVRPVVKMLVADIAKEHGTSMSAMVSEWLEEKLTSLGYNLDTSHHTTDEPSLLLLLEE